MGDSGKFKEEIQRSVKKKIAALIVIGVISFIIGLLLVTLATNEINAVNNLKTIKRTFISLYQHNEDYLLNETTMQLCRELLLGGSDTFKIENSFRRFNMERDVKNEAILCDTDWNIVYTSFSDKELSSYLHNYNNAVCYNARSSSEGEIYNAVYFDSDRYSDYMFVKPIFDQGVIIGYLSLYLSGSDWSYYMSDLNFSGVMTDEKNNVILFNRKNLITNNYKFDVNNSKICYIGGDRYWLTSETLPKYEVTIYSLVYYPNNSAFLIGAIVIAVMGVLWYKLAAQMAAAMAEKNAASINKLVSEIRIIRKKDQNYRVQMNSNDEFEDVAYQINYLLDNISLLNNKNTELLQLNSTIEMNQLTAQINPHFLYNTLEIIRNLVLMDGKKAGEMIIQLTQVLRYSINNSKRDVRLEEDMKYINDYLSIQKCRFGERFQCNIDIDEACGRCTVPKLLLQPIIENSIKYGFLKKMNIRVDLKGETSGDMLYLTVQDDCLGMPPQEAEILNRSLREVNNDSASNGLHNISRRLFLQYGDESGIEIMNEEGRGLTVMVRISQKKLGLNEARKGE